VRKKFNSLLIVRKSSSEIDWIIPVMEKMEAYVKFYTLFLNKKAFVSLKNSKFLYDKWKKVSKNYYVQNKTDRLFFKITKEVLGPFSKTLNEELSYKIHSTNYLKRKLNLPDIKNLHFIFNEFQKTSFWVDSLIKENKNIKLFLYPHTTHIYKYNKKILNNLKKKNIKKKCDAIFLGNKLDEDIWKLKIDKNKIFITGHPKYDQSWQKQFTSKIKWKKNNLIFAVKNITDINSYNITMKYLNSLYKICEKNKYFLTIKLPPYPQNKLLEIISNFKIGKKTDFFEISNDNIFKCLKKSKLLINFNLSATSLDALSSGIPVIQLPAISKLKEKYGKNDSVYTDLNLVYKVPNIEKMEKKIKNIINNNFKKVHKNYYKYFSKKQNASKKVSNIIIEKIS
tara:strand:+ start:669 stop:1856 length:1188 start_codon:yes stop_codon:yes gene_type:complete